jgi:16S rRNA (adenine1518-N6/adenine1519-N6)-dimethyltransferase
VPDPRRIHGPRPRKELGQHFLQDEEIACEIVRSAGISWADRTVEIGPGRGVLLRFLLKASHHVTAIELDYRLQALLHTTFGGHPGLDLIFADFMAFDLAGFVTQDSAPVVVVGNIPYSLSSPILFRLLETAQALRTEDKPRLRSAVLMVQREVARRIAASPGGRDYGGITVLRALVAEAKLLFEVPPSAFFPPPKVTSALVRLDFFAEPRYAVKDAAAFSALVHHVFRQRRKMLKNTLGSMIGIKADWQTVEFNFTRRPEELSAQEFVRLTELVL